MAKLGKKLGKLSLAILENFVEGTLGEKFVDELRAPTGRALAIESALENAEDRFVEEFEDRTFAGKIFTQVSDQSVGWLSQAVGEFYDHPTRPGFPKALAWIISESFPSIDEDRIHRAVHHYITILTEELALADSKFRENVSALADLRGEKSQQEMVEILRRVETLLSQRDIAKAAATVFHPLHQLPQPPRDFTGRELLIAQLLEDFKAHKGAAISGLTGMGGIGKTALGLVVAHKIADEYPDAQIFLDLKGTTAPLSAMEVMRHVILSFEPGMDLRTPDEGDLSGAYRSVLHGKRVLLFFDNARSAEQIASLVPPENCAMLLTSRWTFGLPGLRTRRLDVMEEGDAKEFLLELCPRIDEAAGELARACAYLPLALRIAGSFLGVNGDWRVDTYLDQLDDRKGRLITLQHSHDDAELTTEPDLLATFELSYSGLSEEDRKRWRTLGVFPASFDLRAAAGVWDLEEEETARLLGVLRRYSLLEYDETASRYSLHDLLADYALSKMEEDEERTARISHASHYSKALGAINQMFLRGGDNILPALRIYDIEWMNIQAGQAVAASYLEESREAAEACNGYARQGSMNGLRLKPDGQIHWIEAGIRASRVLENKKAEAAHLGNLGNAYADLGDARKAVEFYEQDLAIAREINDRRGEGAALGNLGIAYADLGDARKAIESYEGQLVITREIGDRRGEGAALGNLGIAYADLGDARKAVEFYEQALVIHRETGDRRGEGNALNNLGSAYADLGDARKAVEFYEQVLVIARELGDRRGEGAALGNLGIVYNNLGELRKAVEFYKQALAIDREFGDRHGEGIELGNLGNAYAALGDARKAIEFYERRMEIAREIGDRRGEAISSWNLGDEYAKVGELKKAIEAMQILVDFEREIGHPDAEKHAARVEALRKK